MKTIVLGDAHGRQFWKYVVNTQQFDRVVFIGDYLDSFDISGNDQLNNLLDIIEFRRANPDKVTLLLGNHDIHYFPEIGDTGTSGYQAGMAPSFEWVFSNNRDLFQMAYRQEDVLFTHAGVTPTWLDKSLGEGNWKLETIEQHVNDVWKYQPPKFCFKMYRMSDSPYGDNVWQSPVWVRPRSLMQDAQQFKKEIVQVVGHTGQNCIDIKGKSTGGRYFFIDTLGTSREYLILEDGKYSTSTV